jgi:hypothetical protein
MDLYEIATLVSPSFIIGGFLFAIVRWLWKRREAEHIQEAAAQTAAQKAYREELAEANKKQQAEFLGQVATQNADLVERLEKQAGVQLQTLDQATKTNGRVNELEQQQKTFEREHSVFRERLSHVEGQAEVLLREKGQAI